MTQLKVGSLFSGIGGIDLGLERAGMRVVWQVEKDEYARKVLKKHWPAVECLADVNEVHGTRCPYNTGWPNPGCPNCAPLVDVLAGGFPCQDISFAGKGAGIKEGTRSGLWSEFARLVREIRPRYVLVENVPALRSRGLARVLGDLAACGYDAEWDCFPASAFGTPHRRDRIFIVAYSHSERRDGVSEIFTRQPRKSWREQAGNFTTTRTHRGRIRMVPPPSVCTMANGIPSELDELRCLGNAVVPQIAEYIGRLIVKHAGKQP